MISLKQALLELRDEIIKNKINSKIVLAIHMPSGENELIISENAIEKINYIEGAYDDNLHLKSNKDIFIDCYMVY